MNLESNRAPGSTRTTSNFRKQVSWTGLGAGPPKYPSIQAIQYLSEAVNELIEVAAIQK